MSFLLKDVPELEVIGEADNLNDAVALIQQHKPGLVFLDIQLRGENGFDLLEQVCVDFKIIFVTAYDDYAIRAFDVNACDYLLKPVDPQRLKVAINRILEKTQENTPGKKKYNIDDSIYLKQTNYTSRFVEINSIIAIISLGNHSRISTLDGRRYIILKTLKQWESELPDPFIRIHRATIINKKEISRIDNYTKGRHRVFLNQIDDPFDVSRNCFKTLKNSI
ncbi:MAG: response regulator transcription factor [Deltaproteobacteria bacterium]|nr:response regulator transcription factor [Deltaproteobacteria bacterium]